jgi:flagellar motor switch protein FliN
MMDDTENPGNPDSPDNKAPVDVGANIAQEELIASWGDEGDDNIPTAAEQLKHAITHGVTDPKDLEAVFDVPVQVSAVLGRATMPVHQLLKLGRGAVIELDRRIGEAIDVYVNNMLVARGEVVVVEDRLGITMTEIIKTTSKT